MKYLSIIMLLVSSMICTSTESNAALMKYSFEFEVGNGAAFNANTLPSETTVLITVVGETDEIYDVAGDDYLPVSDALVEIQGHGSVVPSGDWVLVDGGGVVILHDRGSVDIGSLFCWPDIEVVPLLTGEYNLSAGIVSIETYEGGGNSLAITSGLVVAGRYATAAVPIPGGNILLTSGLVLLIGFRRKLKSRL